MKRQYGHLRSITSWFLQTEADIVLFFAHCSHSEGYLGYYKGQKWWGWFSSSKKSYLRSMCFCLWEYGYAVLPCKSTSCLHPHLHSKKKRVRAISQQPRVPFLWTILTTETFSLCCPKISISAISISDLCDPHLLQNRLYSEKGLSLALGYVEGFFRNWRGQMGKLIIHVKNISYCVKLACEECCCSLSYVLGTLTDSASCIHSLSRSMVIHNQITLVYKSGAEKPTYYKLLYKCSTRFFPPLPTTMSWGEKGGECDLQINTSLS